MTITSTIMTYVLFCSRTHIDTHAHFVVLYALLHCRTIPQFSATTRNPTHTN